MLCLCFVDIQFYICFHVLDAPSKKKRVAVTFAGKLELVDPQESSAQSPADTKSITAVSAPSAPSNVAESAPAPAVATKTTSSKKAVKSADNAPPAKRSKRTK